MRVTWARLLFFRSHLSSSAGGWGWLAVLPGRTQWSGSRGVWNMEEVELLSSRLAFSCPGATQSERDRLGMRDKPLHEELLGWSHASSVALTWGQDCVKTGKWQKGSGKYILNVGPVTHLLFRFPVLRDILGCGWDILDGGWCVCCNGWRSVGERNSILIPALLA